jgi:hypothetical protein
MHMAPRQFAAGCSNYESCIEMFAGAWASLLVSVCLVSQLTAAAAQSAFLQDQLPLRVLVTTPTALSTYSNSSSAVTLTGRQALTVRDAVLHLPGMFAAAAATASIRQAGGVWKQPCAAGLYEPYPAAV